MRITSINFIAACFLLYGCGVRIVTQSLLNTPPSKKYLRSLQKAELDKTALAQAWIGAGEKALHDSVLITLPFSESGYFQANNPEARSYRFDTKEGQVLTINGAVVAKENALLFLDLFVLEDSVWQPLAHADSSLNLTYEFTDNEHCLVRIQPELLITAYYTLNISITPVLLNPVKGASNKSIGSFYGAPRDGGRRSHEGVDIFAKKGTPVIAPTDGYITRVNTTKLGGKVVWMNDGKRRHAYYFAHLDSQMVKPGVKVKQGDVVGTVGNTGNARYTPAHLHFGIYQSKSIDPINYIRTLEATVNALPWDTTFRQPDFKVTAKRVTLRSGPGEHHLRMSQLSKDTYVKVIAQSNNYYRVLLPNFKQGFISKNVIKPVEKGKRLKVKHSVALLSEVNPNAVPIAHLQATTVVEVLAHFEDYKFIKTKEGFVGWLMDPLTKG